VDCHSRWGAFAALCVLSTPIAVAAQTDCPPTPTPGPVESTPSAGAQAVELNARIRVLYSPGYFAPDGPRSGMETIELYDADGFALPGAVRQVGGEALFFFPGAPLEPFTTYSAVATGAFADLSFTFTTGSTIDSGPPLPGRFTRVSVDEVGASCSAPSGGYRVSASFTPADDDGALGSMEYQLFLTRGPGVTAPVRVARLRHFAAGDELTMGFVLDEAQADSIVCVALRVEDGLGQSSDAGGACFDPVTGAYFEPLCSISAAGARPRSLPSFPTGALGLAALVLVTRRRRR
jgi:MYXO-CTERM domain-containing protein